LYRSSQRLFLGNKVFKTCGLLDFWKCEVDHTPSA
jgi:hypothetical protein